MRAWLMMPLLAGLLAGCVGDAPTQVLQGPSAFIAEYALAMTGGNEDWAGRLHMRLDGPQTIADRDLELRSAYQLAIETVWWPADEAPRDDGELVVHHLDGALRVARVDWTCPSWAFCNGVAFREWQPQGSPAPYGVGWTEPLRYQVDGRWTEVQTQLGDLRGLPDGSLLPWGRDQEANLRFHPGALLPDALQWVNKDDPLSPYDGTYEVVGELVDLTVGDPLPVIAEWPMREWGTGSREHKFLPGETEEAFGMGITFLEGYEQLLASSTAAREADAAGCARGGYLYYGGGGRAGFGPVASSSDVLAINLLVQGSEQSQTWEMRYQASSSPLDATLEPVLGPSGGYTDVESNGDGTRTIECPARPGVGLLGAGEMLRNVWALDLQTGDPCSVHFSTDSFQRTGQVGTTLSGFSIGTTLGRPGDEPNKPWGMTGIEGWLVYNAEDGLLELMSFQANDDPARLDAGKLGGRAPPTEPRQLLAGPSFRCVPPEYTEGPFNPLSAPWPSWPGSMRSPASPWR